jgi:hypothetical protein
MLAPVSLKGAAIAAPFVLALAGWIAWQEAFPEHFTQTFGIDGKLERAKRIGGKLVLLEDVSRKSSKGPSYRASRIRVVDAKTGAMVAGPWGVPKQKWLGFAGELLLSENAKTGVEGRSLATGEVVLTMAELEALSPEIAGHLKPESAQFSLERGRLGFRTDQGRQFLVDPVGLRLAETGPPEVRPRPLTAAPPWRTVQGDRKSLTGGEPSLLLPQWLTDAETQEPFASGGVFLARHYDRIGASGGEGLMVSAIRLGGTEAWKHTPALPGVGEVFAAGDDLVLIVETHGGDWGIEALELSTGKVRWSMTGAL